MALTGFDVTISCANSTNNHVIIAGRLNEVFKKWVFQQERGEESGYLHWQIRGHLHKPTTAAACVSKFREILFGGRISVTSKGVHQGNNFNYMMKADTRVEGPWTEKDIMTAPPTLTRQLKEFFQYEPRPWQKKVKEQIVKTEDRCINILMDNVGNTGKSIFCESLEYEGLAYEIPPMTCMEDIMQCCMGIPGQKAYLIDMPRGMRKEKLAGFYSGIEALKNGTMYDKRHSFQKRRIDRPQIWVFTNHLPDFNLMSKDRWVVWVMDENYDITDITRSVLV